MPINFYIYINIIFIFSPAVPTEIRVYTIQADQKYKYIYVASMTDGATGRQVGNLVSQVSVNSNSSQLAEIL